MIIKIIKIVCSMVAVTLILLGIVGLFYNMDLNNNQLQRLDEPISISGANQVLVDHMQTIYIGNAQNGSVQIFNCFGEFLYGYIFPTSGGDLWMSVSDSKLYIYSVRTHILFVLNNGEIENEISIQYNSPKDFYMQQPIDVDDEYKIEISYIHKKAKVISNNNPGNVILMNAPVWPMAIAANIVLFGLGVIILFCCNIRKFEKMVDGDG